VPAGPGAGIEAVLLAALARAVLQWTGQDALLVDLEGHGRQEVLPGLDVSRTVGWFTSIHPVLLRVAPGADPAAALAAVRGQLAAIPGHGLAFGLARHLSGDTSLCAALGALPRAEIAFNYLGRFDGAVGRDARFRLVDGDAGSSRSPRARRRHLLEVNGGIIGGRLRMRWSYVPSIHDKQTVDRLAHRFLAELERLIDVPDRDRRPPPASAAPGAGFGWSPEDIDDIMTEIERRG
jgi:non-ribosomal peptide synthase protein (TIGR01720 family)